MERYKNPGISAQERAKDLLSRMTTQEKLAQLTGVMAVPGHEERLMQLIPHGIGQISTLEFRNQPSHQTAAAWQRKLQKMVMGNSRFGIPAVFHMEGLCGPLMEGGVSFPSGIARGASFHAETEKEIGRIVARQELACGITQVLAPVLDVSRDPRMGRYCEPYGEDGTLVAQLGAAYTEGIQTTKVDGRCAESAAKHFLGFHASQGGIHGTNAELGEPLIREVFGKPFQAAIRESGLKGVMPCYNSINGMPVHASENLLTGLLRKEMGFEGVTVSDYSGAENVHHVQKVAETPEATGYLCMKAGLDVELPMPCMYAGGLAERFDSGEMDKQVLDRACLRVLTAKFRMGLFEHPFALEEEELDAVYRRETDRAVSLRAARESIVLLKNDGVLPWKTGVKTIAVIGPHAVNARFFFGGYTHVSMVEAARAAANSMAGTGGGGSTAEVEMKRIPGTDVQRDDTPEFTSILPWLKPDCRSLLEELQIRMPATEFLYAQGYQIFGSDESGYAEALEAARKADLVLLTLGGKNGSGSVATMGEGVDGTDIHLPVGQDGFIRRVKALGKPLVGIHLDGRPISSDTADELLDAILECWSPAECGAQAIVDVLTGAVNPSGKLPVTVARSAGQLPIWYNHVNGAQWHQGRSIGFQDYVDMPHTPRYPFGFGLSYARFAYQDLHLSCDQVAADGAVTITATISNIGDAAGTEIVQLYVRDQYASRIRPVKELAGFVRVSLLPGERKQVIFTLPASQLAFFMKPDEWLIEKGEVEVQLGASSEDIRLSAVFRIADSRVIRGRERGLWAKAQVNEM